MKMNVRFVCGEEEILVFDCGIEDVALFLNLVRDFGLWDVDMGTKYIVSEIWVTSQHDIWAEMNESNV